MDIGNIAELNTFLVLDAIRSRGHATRRQLVSDLGLSNASVSRIVKRLLSAGLIAEEPGAGAVRGRIPAVLRFVGPPGGVIAVDLGGTRCHGALADLAGSVVAEDFRPAAEGSAAVGALLSCIGALEARAGELQTPARAAVVGIPALIDPVTGLATAGPNVHWQGLDLLGMLRENLELPFEVDNDVNLGALGQAWRGAGRGAHSFMLISIGTGVGGAVVIDGHLIRGRHNAAGEIAYFPVGSGTAGGGAAGAPAGFEDVASGTALRARAAALIAGGARSSLSGEYTVAGIFAAARLGDEAGGQVVRELIGHVTAAIAGATALVDPERIILDGSIGRALEPWLEDLRSAVAARVFRPPDIVVSKLGPNATVLGAIARALAIVAELDGPPVAQSFIS
ncbi:MAG: ROK family transcriptional regulator [Streptosporangiaceae bacterium]|nr:ROK family transcriptional regulator [Streptosporangiaceae bacterium]MBV9856483.1 ROK family transcriptional regulator [Streptosporangiaceae bacterium]